MDSTIFVTALVVSVTYALLRFVEMRTVLKESKPPKLLLRDAALVYVSVLVAHFATTHMGPLKALKIAPDVFTNAPDF